jgi:hypothetical protein
MKNKGKIKHTRRARERAEKDTRDMIRSEYRLPTMDVEGSVTQQIMKVEGCTNDELDIENTRNAGIAPWDGRKYICKIAPQPLIIMDGNIYSSATVVIEENDNLSESTCNLAPEPIKVEDETVETK